MRHLSKLWLAAAALVPLAGPAAGQSAADVVAQHNAAYQTGDFEAFMATFADDAVVVDEGTVLRGRAAIASTFVADFAPGAPRPQVERQGRAAGGGIVQEASWRASDGSSHCCTTSSIFVRDGAITRIVIGASDPRG